MIDNSDTEIKAIKASYGDDAKIFLCHWHILRAWRKNVVYKVRPEAGNKANQDQVKEHRKVALDHMIAIMDARTVAEYNDSLRKFKTWAWNNREKWDSGELVTYFEEEYIPKKKTWCRAYRKENYRMDTNNYVESWHRCLKNVYIPTLKKERLDVLVYVLWTAVLGDLMTAHVCVSNGLQKRVWTQSEKARKKEADAIPEEEAEDLLLQVAVKRILVRSFTNPRTKYTIIVDDKSNVMERCSCPDYRNSKGICKHMFLVFRLEMINLPHQATRIDKGKAPARSVPSASTPNTREVELKGAIAKFHSIMQSINNHASRVNVRNYDETKARYINQVNQKLESVFSLLKEHDNANASLNGHQRRV
ncbi:hypothetical protein O0I10_013212, partial [Lichtheimia ornata]